MTSRKGKKSAGKEGAKSTNGARSVALAVKFVLTFVGALAVFETVYTGVTARHHDGDGVFMKFTSGVSGGVAALFADITQCVMYFTCSAVHPNRSV